MGNECLRMFMGGASKLRAFVMGPANSPARRFGAVEVIAGAIGCLAVPCSWFCPIGSQGGPLQQVQDGGIWWPTVRVL